MDHGPAYPCLSGIISLSPSLDKYSQDLWMEMYSLKSPISKIKSPYFLNLSISSFISLRNPCLGNILRFVLLK